MSNGLIGEDGTAYDKEGLYGYKRRSPNAYLKGTAKDYEVIVNAAINSSKSDRELADIMHDGNLSDDDIRYVLAQRKKKRGSKSLYSTGQLQFPETKNLLDTKADGDIRLTKQGIQYDIQNNDANRKVIEGTAYNSFVKYEEMVKDLLSEDTEYNNPNELFEQLVNQDTAFQAEIAPFQNLINRVDLKIAEDLGIREKYEKELLEIGSKNKGASSKLVEGLGLTANSWAPMSGIQQLQDKYASGKADDKSAFSQVFKEMQRQEIPFASQQRSSAFGQFFSALGARAKGEELPKTRPTIAMEGFESEGLKTDDPVTAIAQIRDKYREKYGEQYSEVFQEELKGKIPENYAESEFFMRQVEDAMHAMGSSVDLNGDNRIYQRGTAVSRAYNQFVLDTYDMVASTAAVVADLSGNEAFIKETKQAKEQIANKMYLEGKVEYGDFNLNDYITEGEGTATGLVNKSLGLTAKSLPYMIGIAGIQKASVKKGFTVAGSKTLGKYTASTVGMGTISAATAYSDGMGQDWFEDMSLTGKLAYAGVHGLAEGGGETVSFAIFNRMFAPVFKAGAAPTKKTATEFIMGGAKAFGWQVSEEIAAESATAVVQTTAEIVAKGEEVTYQKLKPRLEEAIEGAILMTATLKGASGAARAPFEVQNLHIARAIGFGDAKLRSRAKITALSEEYQKAKTDQARSIIGNQLAKALAAEAERNQKNAAFYEAVRNTSPEDHAKLLEIADGFQEKVKQWNAMEDGAAKQSLGAEIKEDFQAKLAIEEKYKNIQAESAPVDAAPESREIARKINAGESLTLDEETFYAENQAEVEDAVSDFSVRELYVPFEMDGEIPPTIEYDGSEGFLGDLINHFETVGEDVFKGFKTTREAAIKGLMSIQNAVKAIKSVKPDAKVFVHTSAKAFKDATGLEKLTRGYFTKGNEIHFLAPAMVSNTGYHESTHGAFGDVLGEKSYTQLFGDIAKMIEKSGIEGATVGQVLRNFISGYAKSDRAEEAVVEFIAMLADGKFQVEIEKGILRQIAETLGNALGFKVSIPSRVQGVQILTDIASSLRDGSPINPESIEKLKKKGDKGGTRGDRAQIIGENGNLKPEVSNRLVQAKEFYEMLKDVKSEEEIERILKESFGWSIGVDGKWRYEIEYPTVKVDLPAGTNIKGAKLSDVIDTELFEIYPESKDISVDIKVSSDGTGRAEAWYSPSRNFIEIYVKNGRSVKQYLVHELQHWVQHREMMATGGSYETFFGGTQEAQKLYEEIMTPLKPFMEARDMARYLDYFAEGAEESGFAGNYNDLVNMSPEQVVEASQDILDEEQAKELIEFLSNLDEGILDGMTENIEEDGWWSYKGYEYNKNAAFDYWDEVVKKSDSANGYQLYQRLAGEVEARNAETRSDFSVEQLRKKPLSTTEDVAREDQILVYPQIDINKTDFSDGNSAATLDESGISQEAGKAQVITSAAPTFTLQEALSKTDGRVLVITSDNTGIGNIDGKDVMGGIGYSFIEKNIKDGVGFASTDLGSVSKVRTMVESIGKGEDVTVLVMQQHPDGMLGNFYAADYLSEAITQTFKNNRKQAANQIKDRLMSLTPIKNSGEVKLVEEFIDSISKGFKSEAVAKIVEEMSFPLRRNIVQALLPKGYGVSKGTIRINPNAQINVPLVRQIAQAGFSQVDFWRKYSSPETKTDEYIEGALNGDWGYTYSGFVTNPSLDWGSTFQETKGVSHPQFNAKLPSKETFKLDGGYQVDEAFKELLTYGFNKKEGKFTTPPFGLRQTTSQSIFAGSFQQVTQDAVLELVSEPTTDPFNEFALLSSTPQGKAQIIGEIGASNSHKEINKLELARDMEAEGVPADRVFFATGWYRGMDNQWRKEIQYGYLKRGWLKELAENSNVASSGTFKLTDIFEASELYQMYPRLKEYNLVIEKMSAAGYHQERESKIAVNKDYYFDKTTSSPTIYGLKLKKERAKDFLNTIYHEIQHAVQSIEGVTDGYNAVMVKGDTWYSKKRTVKSSKAQFEAAMDLFADMMEVTPEGLSYEHRLLSYAETALKMNEKGNQAHKQLEDDIIRPSTRWIKQFTLAELQQLAKMADVEITQENVSQYDEILRSVLMKRNRVDSDLERLYKLLPPYDNIKSENGYDDEATLASINFTTKAIKWFMENGGKEAFIREKKFQRAIKKHMGNQFDYVFDNIYQNSLMGQIRINERIEYLQRIAKAAVINMRRFTPVGGIFGDMKRSASRIYMENLGEAEARLAGERGTTKVKDRAPLISELYPDVHPSEIWEIPPAEFYLKMRGTEAIGKKAKSEIKKIREKVEDINSDAFPSSDDLDFLSQAPDKIQELRNQISEQEKRYKIYEKKIADGLAKFQSQKGKAQLIEGTTEYEVLKKQIQEEMIKDGLDNFSNESSYVNRFAEHFRFKFADKYRPLQNLQNAIEEAKGRVERTETNFRRAEALMHGKAAEDARQFEEKLLKPLMDKMIEYGITNEQLSEYLYALHAYERNEFVKNTIDPANESGSGMSNEVAEQIKKKYEPNIDKMNELADAVYKITEASRKKMLDSGLISQQQYDSFKMFEHYVPLTGTAVAPTSDLFDFTDERDPQATPRGAGIAIFGKEYRAVTGRFSEAQSPLETVVSNHLRTISRARKNETLQTLLKLVKENKDAKVWQVFTEENPDMQVRVSRKGESIFIEENTGEEYEYQLRRRLAAIAMGGNPDYVPVKVKGKTTYIKFNDKRITRVLNNGGIGKTNAALRTLNKLSRYLTRVFTSLNPEFIVANLTRDVQTALFNQMAEQNMKLSNISGEAFVTQTLRGLPKAIQSVYQFETNKRDGMSEELRDYYQEYLENGAKTDWFFLKTPEQVEKDMLSYIRNSSPVTSEASLRQKANKAGMSIKKGTNAAFDFIDDLNTSIENGVRFSAYVSARREGVDAEKAAEFAKELTINFNRSGEMGQFANSLYLFFNASVQGSTRLLRSIVKSKKARRVATAMTAFSSMLTMYNIMAGGEDDDGIPYYDKISDYEKERFLIIMYGTEGRYLKLPLPYGLNMFFNAGTATAELALGAAKPMDAAAYFFGSVVNSFSPISLSTEGKNPITTGFRLLMPTAIKPLAELGVNEDYLGNPIYVEQFPFGAKTPASSRSKKSTSEWSKTMAEFLNQATGGNEFVSGALDVSPDAIEYLFKYYTGGAGKFVVRSGKTLEDIAKGKDVDINNVPLARLFFASQRESEPAGRYYEYREELLRDRNIQVGKIKSGQKPTRETIQLAKLMELEKLTQKRIKALNKAQKQAERIEDPIKREEALDKVYEAKMKAYSVFNGAYFKVKQK